MKPYVLVLVLLIVLFLLPVLPVNTASSSGEARSVYVLFLTPDGEYRYYERLFLGVPVVVGSYRDGVDAGLVLDASMVVLLGKPGAYTIDESTRQYIIEYLNGGGTVIINTFAVPLLQVMDYVLELLPGGNYTVYMGNGTTWGVVDTTTYSVLKVYANTSSMRLYAWINYGNETIPVIGEQRIGNGTLIVLAQRMKRSMLLEKLYHEYLLALVLKTVGFTSYGWINARNMAMLRLDDFFPYTGMAEDFDLVVRAANIAGEYNTSILYGVVANGRVLEAVSLDANYTGTITRIGVEFKIYDSDGDGVLDKIVYDTNMDGNLSNDQAVSLTSHVVINDYNITLTALYPDNKNPTIAKFGLGNNITSQYNQTILDILRSLVDQHKLELCPHGWNHWSAGLTYQSEIYRPVSYNVYSPDEYAALLTRAIHTINQTLGQVLADVEIRPYGDYGHYPGDDANLREALRLLGITSLSTTFLAYWRTETSLEKLDGAIYIDGLQEPKDQSLKDKLEQAYIYMVPVNIFTHPTAAESIDFYQTAIQVVNQDPHYILATPTQFIETYKQKIESLTTPWNTTIYDDHLEIQLKHYNGMTILLRQGKHVEGGEKIGTTQINGTTYDIILVKQNTLNIYNEDSQDPNTTTTTTAIVPPPPTPEPRSLVVAGVLLGGLIILVLLAATGITAKHRSKRF